MELRERVAELVKLRDAATPGPWERRYSFNIFAKERHIASAGGHSNSIRAEQVHNENNANAALIAAAPAAVTLCADLMAARDALAARVEELESAVEAVTEEMAKGPIEGRHPTQGWIISNGTGNLCLAALEREKGEGDATV